MSIPVYNQPITPPNLVQKPAGRSTYHFQTIFKAWHFLGKQRQTTFFIGHDLFRKTLEIFPVQISWRGGGAYEL